MRTNITILLVIGILLLCGCTVQEKYWGPVSPVFINENVKELIASTKVVVSLDQDKRMGVPVLGQRTSHQYYGVIGRLVESATTRREVELPDEQRRLLHDIDAATFRYDISDKFRKAAESSLRKTNWLNVSSVNIQNDIQITEIENMVKTMDEDALLVIDNRYLMAIDFSSITVFSYVTLYAHQKTLAKMAEDARPYEKPPTLYQHMFTYDFRYDGRYTTANDALMGWSKNEGEMVQRALTESIADLTKQITTDLSYVTSQ